MTPTSSRLLFGGATARKKYANGKNSWGNDWEATQRLSNYTALQQPVTYGGVEFPSVEQAYVAAKFNNPEPAIPLLWQVYE